MCKDDANGNHICYNSPKCLDSAICRHESHEFSFKTSKDLRALGARAAVGHVTISGLSSGADFAVQFQVAYSSLVSGSCIFAGQTYHCAKSSPGKSCKTGPIHKVIDTPRLVEYAKDMERLGHIDALSNLQKTRIYLYRGMRDMRYQKSEGVDSVGAVGDFFSSFVRIPAKQIFFEDSIPSTHVWPTKQFGPRCGTARSQAMEACDYDGASACLVHVYANTIDKVHRYNSKNERQHYHSFDQRPFFGESWPGLADEGVIYIPAKCQGQPNSAGVPPCKLHVALHGCGVDHYYDLATKKSGFSEMAELNGIIILWPRMKQNDGNSPLSTRHYRGTMNTRLGCWDGWGETGEDYALKSGLQMAAIQRMIVALQNPYPSSLPHEETKEETKQDENEAYEQELLKQQREIEDTQLDRTAGSKLDSMEYSESGVSQVNPTRKVQLKDDAFTMSDIPIIYYFPICGLALLALARKYL